VNHFFSCALHFHYYFERIFADPVPPSFEQKIGSAGSQHGPAPILNRTEGPVIVKKTDAIISSDIPVIAKLALRKICHSLPAGRRLYGFSINPPDPLPAVSSVSHSPSKMRPSHIYFLPCAAFIINVQAGPILEPDRTIPDLRVRNRIPQQSDYCTNPQDGNPCASDKTQPCCTGPKSYATCVSSIDGGYWELHNCSQIECTIFSNGDGDCY